MPTDATGASPNRLPRLLVRGHDDHAVWTWIALLGLIIAVLLAILGLPHADLHGVLHYIGVMDPLCGGTRSVYLTMHGQLREAVRYNPAGPVVVAVAVALLIRTAIGWSTRRWIWMNVPRPILIPLTVVAIAALEVNQQLHAALLVQPWAGG